MPRNWKPFSEAVGHPEWQQDPRFATAQARNVHNDDLMGELYAWAATETKREAYDRAGRMRAPISFVHTMADLLDSPHLNERGYLTPIQHPVAGESTYAGPPWWMGPDAWSSDRAPLLGEHTGEILRDVAGMSASELERLAPGVLA
jgi:formyl-CoA transferase